MAISSLFFFEEIQKESVFMTFFLEKLREYQNRYVYVYEYIIVLVVTSLSFLL